MATNSPPPSSLPSAVPPASGTTPSPPSNTSPPPSQSSPPPDPSTTSPPSQPNANPPDSTTPSTPSPPPVDPSAPPQPPRAPPPSQNSTSSPLTSAQSPPPSAQQSISPTSSPPPSIVKTPPPPPVSNPPTISPPPPPPSKSPPPPSPVSNPPTSSPPPPPPSEPPRSSTPPPPSTEPPRSSTPPPPSAEPPRSSTPPPPSTEPPRSSPPPPPSTEPPRSSPPPPPSTEPPKSSPPPSPASVPPQNPPPSAPPRSSPPPPVAVPPSNGSPPPTQTPSPPAPELAPPPSNSSSKSSTPPPIIQLSPPPPSQIQVPPTNNTNDSIPSSTESSRSSNNNGIGTAGVVAITLAAGIIALSLIGLAFWCLRKRRKEVYGFNGVYVMPSPLGSSPRSDSSAAKTHSSAPLIGSGPGSDFVYSPKEPGGLGNSRALFTYEELIKATNGFSTQNFLGKGGFGSVYKGYLPDGREVAIKQLKVGGGQGEREFKAEVEIISRIHHRHLVSLVGYCISENQRLLIYDYVPNNTLHFHLHGRPVLEWATRVKIAAGAARGIAYLHEDCQPRIIHRDIKSSNILLDNNFEAQVSDFGLAKLALDANTHVTTRVMGTFGYMAPEYASSGKLTEKSDVFSFGVVLLELITGRKPVDASQPVGDESLVEWARPLLSHVLENEEFESLVDPRLGKNYVASEMFRMIEAAAACVRHSAAKRPRMGQVVRAFDNLAASDLTNGMKVGESEVFNSAQQSAEIRLFRRMAFGSQNYSTDFFSQGSWDN